MNCPTCHKENPTYDSFCRECGASLLQVCIKCRQVLDAGDKFCGKCGQRVSETTNQETSELAIEGERKHVTVLFSDLSGYTAMSEKIDPEELKDITGKIFKETSDIIAKYDGFVEKYAGDAVMALFGVPRSHEDDPIRAIRASKEIHDSVERLSPEIEKQIGQSVSMHSGINTGLVVTGEVDVERGTHGVAGDTINVASRLSQLAQAGEILVDADTFRQSEGHFNFKSLGPTNIKGKTEPVHPYKVSSPKDKPITIHRLSGVRADLVGRQVELNELSEAVDNLRQGRGTIFTICGNAGTGKSRLVEEFKGTLDMGKIQWIEGHAYAYAQNTPYYAMIDLLNRVFHIEEGDPVQGVREKVENGVGQLIDNHAELIPYIGSLYSLSYPEIEEVSPEYWKSKLQAAILAVLTALAKKAPTVFFLEDLHWADPSFVELLRNACLQIRQPAIVLCVFRPNFSLFESHEVTGLGRHYHEMELQDLSRSESQEMVQSLLKTDKVPSELLRFVREKMAGNPFYLEESINTLIESKTLVRDNGHWQATRQITDADISSTIQGVISARVDRLETESKRILQEASVIGRSFYYEILKKISELKDNFDQKLNGLERLDLIKAKSIRPDLEYIFKHALTQEVIYNGLLIKDRKEIHERIGVIIEHLFDDRLPEFYETLAFHYSRSRSVQKAVDYMMKSGEKSLKHYAVEESHNYFQEAYAIILDHFTQSPEDNELRINLLNRWALVYYYRGDFIGLTEIYQDNLKISESLPENSHKGMFIAWLGAALTCRAKFRESYDYFKKALIIGDKSRDESLVGFVCCWLPWSCSGLGLLDEAIMYGVRAQAISKRNPSDQYIYFKSLGGLAIANFWRGAKQKVLDYGKELVDFGRSYSNIRSQAMGLWTLGLGHMLNGDAEKTIDFMERSVQTAADPFYAEFPRAFLGIAYVFDSQWDNAEKSFYETIKFARFFGAEVQERWANMYLGIVMAAKGRMSEGIALIEKTRQSLLGDSLEFFSSEAEFALGKSYLQMVVKKEPVSLKFVSKNIGFLVRTLPFAADRAEIHFRRVYELAKKYGSDAFMGHACLGLGLLHKAKKRNKKARDYLSKAIKFFEKCEMTGFEDEAGEALESIG